MKTFLPQVNEAGKEYFLSKPYLENERTRPIYLGPDDWNVEGLMQTEKITADS